uniref:RRM domain-containing protein n=1 Tax=Anolis carolinensis TaxID=28377 RepID=H9GNQ8_ANOCA
MGEIYKNNWLGSNAEEGGDPDVIPVVPEIAPKKTPKRTSKGRRTEEEGAEDNGLEDEPGEGQEDIEASVDNFQDIDMMEISVLDEADIDNSSGVDCQEEEETNSAENRLGTPFASADNVGAEKTDVPDQRAGSPVENEKMLDILGDTCKSEALDAEEAQAPLPVGQEEEEEALGPDEEPLDSEGKEKQEEKEHEEEEEEKKLEEEEESKALVVEKGEQSGESVKEATADSDSLALESRSEGGEGGGDESSRGGAQALAEEEKEETEEAGPQGEAVKKEALAQGQEEQEEQESSATKEPSAQEAVKSLKVILSCLWSSLGRPSSSSSRNLWVSGLSSSTRATDLKNLFSKYGKVVGAKVVTNARSPGARCYGFVTMSSSDEATKCIAHLHRTELHGKMISVEKVSWAKTHVSSTFAAFRSHSIKKEEKASKKDDPKKEEEAKEGAKTEEEDKAGSSGRTRSVKSGSRGIERTVVMDKSKGEPVISVKTSSTSKERSTKSSDRKSESKEKQDILSFDKIKEQREMERERQREREIRESERRLWQQRTYAVLKLDERQQLRREWERQRLERERVVRSRLERERMYIEQERRREQERIQREREELRRQQEQLRYEQERRSALRRPYDLDGRRDDPYWPEAKRMATEDRYHSDFGRQDRFHGFDHRERSRYQVHHLADRYGRVKLRHIHLLSQFSSFSGDLDGYAGFCIIIYYYFIMTQQTKIDMLGFRIIIIIILLMTQETRLICWISYYGYYCIMTQQTRLICWISVLLFYYDTANKIDMLDFVLLLLLLFYYDTANKIDMLDFVLLLLLFYYYDTANKIDMLDFVSQNHKSNTSQVSRTV